MDAVKVNLFHHSLSAAAGLRKKISHSWLPKANILLVCSLRSIIFSRSVYTITAASQSATGWIFITKYNRFSLFSFFSLDLCCCLISGWCYLCQDNSKFELRIRFAPGFHPPRTVYFFFPIFNWITNHESAVPASKGSNDWPKLVPENRHRLRLTSTSHAEKLSPGKRGKLKITPFRHRFTEVFFLFFFHFCRCFCFKSAQRASESSCRAGGGEKIQTKTIFQFLRLCRPNLTLSPEWHPGSTTWALLNSSFLFSSQRENYCELENSFCFSRKMLFLLTL